ncbi:MAG TPA: hypothetical protein VF723_14035 [Pyrinomonadaceae bacterium]
MKKMQLSSVKKLASVVKRLGNAGIFHTSGHLVKHLPSAIFMKGEDSPAIFERRSALIYEAEPAHCAAGQAFPRPEFFCYVSPAFQPSTPGARTLSGARSQAED